MATPLRFPEFDMSSARRPPAGGSHQQQSHGIEDSIQHSHYSAPAGGNSSGRPPPGGSSTIASAGNREVEQRFARLVAESEYKLLEEKARAHEREAKLKEELAREKAMIPKLVNERVEQALREKERELGLNRANDDSLAAGDGFVPVMQVERLKQQLVETQRLLADAERRYQQEKRELLNLRTAQLKNETSKRGQEGDIISRAMQVMSEYETIVRSSEENSLARLAHHMETFEKEWIKRSKEFEERKAEFETSVMSKALESLQLHNQDVETIGRQIMDKTVDILRSQSEARLHLEEQVLLHSESFKQQYKEMLEGEFRERCRQYDERVADRERNLSKILQLERERIIQTEQQAIVKHEAMHVQALTDAMTDISQLREQLVREHQEQQEQAIRELIERRNQMRDEQQELIDMANQRVSQVEKQCFAAVDTAQRALKDMQMQMASREAELTRQLMEMDSDKDSQMLKQINAARDEVEAQWKHIVEELQSQHGKEVERMTSDYHSRLDKERQEQHYREQEMRKTYEQRMIKVEEAADTRWATRQEEANRALERHLSVIQSLRQDNEHLTGQLSSLQQQFSLRENEIASKVAQTQREYEQMWHRKIEEMRQRYDQLLDDALGGSDGEKVTRAEYERALAQVRELEERCVFIKATEAARCQEEIRQLSDMWRNRLEEERSERSSWEQDQLKKLADLRIEIQADARRKETEMLRRLEQERIKAHEITVGRSVEERRDRDAFEDRVRQEAETRVRESEEELQDAYLEKVRVFERRIEEKEVQLEQRRLDLKREQARIEEESKAQAAEWLEKEKKEILADVKKFHEKLVEEQHRIESERTNFEQRISMQYAEQFEQSKAELFKHVTSISVAHMVYMQECEENWLTFRGTEMSMLQQERVEHTRRCAALSQAALQAARQEANAIVSVERQRLDENEAKLYAELEKARLTQEASSRERAIRLLDERNKIQEESETQRGIEEAKLWETLENKVLAKEREAEADRRVLEMELKLRYESMINSERQRVDQLMDQHRQDARELYDRQEQAMRQRDEEWHRHRLQIELEERTNHERQYQDLRQQCEQRVQEERKRFEAQMRQREQEFDVERHRVLDTMDRQFREHEAATRTQLGALKEDYDRRLRMLAQESQHYREQYLADLADQERRFTDQREQYEVDATAKFEKALKDLRMVLEKRTREQQIREIEAKELLEKNKREYEEQLNTQYENLLKDQEKKLLSMSDAREAQVTKMEQEHQEHLLTVRRDMERTLASYFSQADGRSRELAEQTRQQFQTKLEEYYDLVGQERKKRLEAEARLAEAIDEKEILKAGAEQHKLEIHRSIQAKFEKLLAELRDKHRQEREQFARSALEEEEKRLARELLKRGGGADTSSNANNMSTGRPQGWDRPVATPPATTSFSNPPAVQQQFLQQSLQQQTLQNPGTQRSSSALVSNTSNISLQQQQQPPSSSVVRSQVEDEAASELITKRREKLQQLWQVLDFPMQERNSFLDRLVGVSPAQASEELLQETRRLEVQLPLLETITRREFVQHRVRELQRQTGKQRQVDEFMKELQQLSTKLKNDIPMFEKKHNQRFMFRGQRYMDLLITEMEAEGGVGGSRSGTPLQH